MDIIYNFVNQGFHLFREGIEFFAFFGPEQKLKQVFLDEGLSLNPDIRDVLEHLEERGELEIICPQASPYIFIKRKEKQQAAKASDSQLLKPVAKGSDLASVIRAVKGGVANIEIKGEELVLEGGQIIGKRAQAFQSSTISSDVYLAKRAIEHNEQVTSLNAYSDAQSKLNTTKLKENLRILDIQSQVAIETNRLKNQQQIKEISDKFTIDLIKQENDLEVKTIDVNTQSEKMQRDLVTTKETLALFRKEQDLKNTNFIEELKEKNRVSEHTVSEMNEQAYFTASVTLDSQIKSSGLLSNSQMNQLEKQHDLEESKLNTQHQSKTELKKNLDEQQRLLEENSFKEYIDKTTRQSEVNRVKSETSHKALTEEKLLRMRLDFDREKLQATNSHQALLDQNLKSHIQSNKGTCLIA